MNSSSQDTHEPTHYDRLGLDFSASSDDIRARYQAIKSDEETLSQRELRLLDRAYAILANPQRRKEYDATLPARAAGNPVPVHPQPQASTPKTAQDATPCWRVNEARTGELRSALIRSAELEWRVHLPQGASCAPIAVDGRIHVGTRDGLLHAFGQDGGRLPDTRYPRVLSGGTLLAPPLQDAGVLYLATSGGMVHALDAVSGEDRAPGQMLAESVLAAPLFKDDILLVATISGRLRALDAASLEPLWTWPTEDLPALAPIVASPARLGDLVVVVDHAGTVVALDAWRAEGPREAWRIALQEEHVATPLARPRDVCLYSTSGKLTTIRNDGHIICRHNIINALVQGSPTTWGGSKLFIGAANDGLYAQDPITGEGVPGYPVRHQQGGQMVDAITASPMCLGDMVLFGGAAGYLYGLWAPDAKVIWSYRLGEPHVGGPAFDRGRLVVATRGERHGNLLGFRTNLEQGAQ